MQYKVTVVERCPNGYAWTDTYVQYANCGTVARAYLLERLNMLRPQNTREVVAMREAPNEDNAYCKSVS